MNIQVGGEPPTLRPSYGKWQELRDATLALDIVGRESKWLNVKLLSHHEAQQARRALIAVARREGRDARWRYETRILREDDGSATLWVRRISLAEPVLP